jgi:hypothetical protein
MVVLMELSERPRRRMITAACISVFAVLVFLSVMGPLDS